MHNRHERSELGEAVRQFFTIFAIFAAALLLGFIIIGCLSLAALVVVNHATPTAIPSGYIMEGLWRVL